MGPNPRRIVVLAMLLLIILGPGSRMAGAQNSTRQKPPTFSKEIVRIFQNRCQSCHHPGAPFAPMSLVEYRAVRPWAKSILKKVVLREMPPWHADSSVRDFSNDISISQEEIDTIARWVEARAPQGNRADLPPVKVFDNDWQIGEPDVVLDMGVEFDVPATGTLPLQYFRIDTEFETDRWLSAIEVRPGNRDVVRQSDIYVQNPKAGL